MRTTIIVILAAIILAAIMHKTEDKVVGWCDPPEPGERLTAWGSADGKPYCEYHVNTGYGSVPKRVK